MRDLKSIISFTEHTKKEKVKEMSLFKNLKKDVRDWCKWHTRLCF